MREPEQRLNEENEEIKKEGGAEVENKESMNTENSSLTGATEESVEATEEKVETGEGSTVETVEENTVGAEPTEETVEYTEETGEEKQIEEQPVERIEESQVETLEESTAGKEATEETVEYTEENVESTEELEESQVETVETSEESQVKTMTSNIAVVEPTDNEEVESSVSDAEVEEAYTGLVGTEDEIAVPAEEQVENTAVTIETKKPKKEKDTSKQKSKFGIIFGVVFAIIVAVLAYVVTGGGGTSTDKNAKEVVKAVNNLQEVNPYIQMMVGQDKYIYLLYNGKGEAFAESSSGGSAFYRNDNKIISIHNDTVYVDNDINPLSFIKASAEVAANNTDTGCVITRSDSTYTDEERGVEAENHVYTISVVGKENISKIYETLNDEEYVKQSIEMLYNGFEDVEQSQIDVVVSSGETGRFGAVCNVSYGELTENNENTFTSWVFDGYIPTFDWEYPKEMYSNVDTSDVEKWTEILSNVTSDISTKMNEFMTENELISSEAVTSKVAGADFMGLSDEEQIAVLKQVHNDLYNYGMYASVVEGDVLSDVKEYYKKNGTDDNLFQAVVNTGLTKGWLQSLEVEGTQESIEALTEGATEGATEGVIESVETVDTTAE